MQSNGSNTFRLPFLGPLSKMMRHAVDPHVGRRHALPSRWVPKSACGSSQLAVCASPREVCTCVIAGAGCRETSSRCLDG